MKDLKNVVTAMVTPFTTNGEVDYDKYQNLCKKLINEGSDSLLVAGTTGESPTLTQDEKMKLLETAIIASEGKVPIMMGTGSNNTSSTVKASIDAVRAGADALLLVAPYYNKPPQEGLFRHFAAVAEKCSVSIMIYNIPGRTGINIPVSVLERLHKEFPHVNSLKDAAGNVDQTSDTARTMSGHPNFKIYSGDDSLTLPMLSVGACGVVSVASHIAGIRINKMITLYKEGKVKEAAKIHLELLPLFKGLFETTNPILVKEALNLSWEQVGGLRLPLIPATKEQRERLSLLLSQTGVI